MDVPSLLLNIGGKANQGMPQAAFRLGALNNLVMRPRVNISGSTTVSRSPVYVDGIRQQDILKNECGAGGEIGWDFETQSGHRFGGAAQGQYTKGQTVNGSHRDFIEDANLVNVCLEVDEERLVKMWMDSISSYS